MDKTPAAGKNRAMPETACSPPPAIAAADLTGLLLAGGLGRRMGGADKGLLLLEQLPLAQWVIDRLRPQVGPLLISANRNVEDWARFSYPVIADHIGGFAGPLAGIQAGLAACTTPWLVTAPCDSPFLPADLVARLSAAALAADADLAVVRCGERLQLVFSLMRREVLPDLDAFLAGGGRGIRTWFERLTIAVVDFADETAFANINTPQELAAAQLQQRFHPTK